MNYREFLADIALKMAWAIEDIKRSCGEKNQLEKDLASIKAQMNEIASKTGLTLNEILDREMEGIK